jgi:hypothetical protein
MNTQLNEVLKLSGRWRLTARHVQTGEVIVREGKNTIVTVGKGLVGDMLIDTSGFDTGLTYQAIGTGASAPAIGDTALTAEVARLAITSKTRSSNVLTLSTFFPAAQSAYNIEEAGVFGHSTASATLGSGVLFSHWLVSFDNSSGLYDLTFDYIPTIG